MADETISEKEYEAIATIRDILAILYQEISENLGSEPELLSEAFIYMSGLTETALKRLQ